MYKLLTFAFIIKNKQNSPECLKSQLEFEKENSNYELRDSSKLLIKPDKFCTKHGESTFKNLFSKLFNGIKSCTYLTSYLTENNFLDYKKILLLNLDIFLVKFINDFKQFNFEHSFYFLNFKQVTRSTSNKQ